MYQNIDYTKLQDALEEIKRVCEAQQGDGCVSCPLGDKYGTCRLAIHPMTWKTRHPETDAFRMID